MLRTFYFGFGFKDEYIGIRRQDSHFLQEGIPNSKTSHRDLLGNTL